MEAEQHLEQLLPHVHRSTKETRALRRAHDHGDLVRLCRGRYFDTRRWHTLTPAQQHVIRAVALADVIDPELVLSHSSAAAVHNFASLSATTPRIQFSVLGSRPTVSKSGFRVYPHRLLSDQVTTVSGIKVTTIDKTLFDLGCTETLESSLVAADSAIHAHPSDHHKTLLMNLNRLVETHKLRRGAVRAQQMVSLIDPACESPGETLTRYRLHQLKLPLPRSQQILLKPDKSFVGRVDFLWLSNRVVLEFDGKVKYSGRFATKTSDSNGYETLWDEKRREDEIRALGFRVIRLNWTDVSTPSGVAQKLGPVIRELRS